MGEGDQGGFGLDGAAGVSYVHRLLKREGELIYNYKVEKLRTLVMPLVLTVSS